MATNIRAFEKHLPPPTTLKEQLPLRTDLAETIVSHRNTILKILKGQDPRFLVIVGPCSVHDPVAIKDYANKLHKIQKQCPHLFL